MSMKTKIIILLIFHFFSSYSQNNTNIKQQYIRVVKGDKQIESLIVNKDTTSFSISIYINGFESKKKREKALSYHKKKNFKKNLLLPSFTINFISSWKPEKLFSIVDIEHISVKEFANSNLEITHPTYILLEQDDGSYLKWKVFHLAPE